MRHKLYALNNYDFLITFRLRRYCSFCRLSRRISVSRIRTLVHCIVLCATSNSKTIFLHR